MKPYRILFADLDGTLIKTASGDTFPIGIWDMQLRFDVLDAIEHLRPDFLFIVTNQGGIEKGFVDENLFKVKLQYIAEGIQEYTETPYVAFQYCISNDKDNPFRKPNTRMLECIVEDIFPESSIPKFSKAETLMIGDASGKEGQFSDSDKKTAENFGIAYMDVEDFVAEYGYQDNQQSVIVYPHAGILRRRGKEVNFPTKEPQQLWLTRDKDGMLYASSDRPHLHKDVWQATSMLELDKDTFPSVTFENSPQKVDLNLKQ